MKVLILIFVLSFTSCLPNKLQSSFSTQSGLGTQMNVSVRKFDEKRIGLSNLPIQATMILGVSDSNLGVTKLINGGVISYTHLIEDPSPKDSFILDVRLSDNSSSKIVVNIEIIDNDLAPIALDDNSSVAQGKSVNIDVLVNDSDPKKESISISAIVQEATNGVTEISAGKIKYTANAGYIGSDEFVYQIENESGFKGAAKVIINVTEKPVINVGALPMRVIFIMNPGSTKAKNTSQQEADFILKTINDSQKFEGEVHNEYYLDEVQWVEDAQYGNMTVAEFQGLIDKYKKDGVLTKAIVELVPGGVLGIAHGLDCVMVKTGASCKFSGRGGQVVVDEWDSLHNTGGGCDAAPLGCTATHEVGHHLGWFHLTQDTQPYNYTRCNLTDVSYYRTTDPIDYVAVKTDGNGVEWYIGPHAMRTGGGNPQRNKGFYSAKPGKEGEGYPVAATEMHKCYNELSNENLK